jgi:hypothetical protein
MTTQSVLFWDLIKSLGIIDGRKICTNVSADNLKRPYYTWSEEEEMGQLSRSGIGMWSRQASQVRVLLMEERLQVPKRLKQKTLDKDLQRDEDFIMGLFTELSWKNCELISLDKQMQRFVQLKELNVSGNLLEAVRNLPKNLVVLSAYANHIKSLDTSSGVPPLLHLGLGYNKLASLIDVLPFASTLVSLDVSFNHLVSLEELCEVLASLPRLKHVWVAGNPVAMAKHYRVALLARLPGLESLDGIACADEEMPVLASSKPETVEKPTTARGKEKKGKGKGDEEEKSKLEAAAAAADAIQAFEKRQKDKEVLMALALTQQGVDNTIHLEITLGQISGVEDPSLSLIPTDDEETIASKEPSSKAPKAGKGKGKKEAKGGEKRGDWEEDVERAGCYSVVKTEETVDQDENKVQHTGARHTACTPYPRANIKVWKHIHSTCFI